jgi:hypothetical protein
MNPTIPYTQISDERIIGLRLLAKRAAAFVHILRRVPVEQYIGWKNMIDSTTGTRQSSFIRKVADHFPPTSDYKEEVDIVLFSYLERGRFDKWSDMISWGSEAKLQACNPREVFAIGPYDRNLDLTIDQEGVGIYFPIEHLLYGCGRACVLWYHRSHSGEVMDRTVALCNRNVPGNSYVWFAFREPLLSVQ